MRTLRIFPDPHARFGALADAARADARGVARGRESTSLPELQRELAAELEGRPLDRLDALVLAAGVARHATAHTQTATFAVEPWAPAAFLGLYDRVRDAGFSIAEFSTLVRGLKGDAAERFDGVARWARAYEIAKRSAGCFDEADVRIALRAGQDFDVLDRARVQLAATPDGAPALLHAIAARAGDVQWVDPRTHADEVEPREVAEHVVLTGDLRDTDVARLALALMDGALELFSSDRLRALLENPVCNVGVPAQGGGPAIPPGEVRAQLDAMLAGQPGDAIASELLVAHAQGPAAPPEGTPARRVAEYVGALAALLQLPAIERVSVMVRSLWVALQSLDVVGAVTRLGRADSDVPAGRARDEAAALLRLDRVGRALCDAESLSSVARGEVTLQFVARVIDEALAGGPTLEAGELVTAADRRVFDEAAGRTVLAEAPGSLPRASAVRRGFLTLGHVAAAAHCARRAEFTARCFPSPVRALTVDGAMAPVRTAVEFPRDVPQSPTLGRPRPAASLTRALLEHWDFAAEDGVGATLAKLGWTGDDATRAVAEGLSRWLAGVHAGAILRAGRAGRLGRLQSWAIAIGDEAVVGVTDLRFEVEGRVYAVDLYGRAPGSGVDAEIETRMNATALALDREGVDFFAVEQFNVASFEAYALRRSEDFDAQAGAQQVAAAVARTSKASAVHSPPEAGLGPGREDVSECGECVHKLRCWASELVNLRAASPG